MMRGNKKGQDLSIGTLILIVLGIVILVLLILGFSLGWQDLFAKINIFSGGSNIESVVTACNLAVTSNAQASYCNDFKKIKVSGKTEYVNCEDSRIQQSLDKTLDCPSIDYVKDECILLIKQKYSARIKPYVSATQQGSSQSDVTNAISDCKQNFDGIVNHNECRLLPGDYCTEAITALHNRPAPLAP